MPECQKAGNVYSDGTYIYKMYLQLAANLANSNKNTQKLIQLR